MPARGQWNAAMLRALAEDVQPGGLVIPIDRMVPMEDAGEAQATAQKDCLAKILLLA